ncbi:MAG TPA: phosphatidate cytidylyltransferase [Acidimicrobiales bacterium]|nr:phosphatidate cytidylyltransferase [Acidimicrobiales bacterium]
MSDYEDEFEDEAPRRTRTPAEGVRIIGAEEAAAALETGQVARRRPEDAPRYGDVPEKPQGPSTEYRFPLPESVDPASVRRPPPANAEPPELPHWTEPPTGEVPSVLAGDDADVGEDLGAWSGLSRSPRWRDQGTDWEEDDFAELAALGDDDTRVGALDVNRTEHSDLFSFDEPEPEPEAEPVYAPPEPPPAPPRPKAPTRIHSRTAPPADYGAARPHVGSRDMGAAVGVGVGIAAVALAAFAMGNVPTLVLAVVVVTMAAMELFAVFRRAGYQPATLLGLSATIALMLAAYDKGTAAFPLVIALTVVFTFLWYLAEVVRARPTINIAVTLLGFFWVGVLGAFASLLLTFPDRHGIAFLLGAVLCTVAYDVGGLFFGSQMGTRPLMPEISPNKTWEGLIGGFFLSCIAGGLIIGFVDPWTPGKGLLLGLTVGVVAPLGDLCQSMVKRDIGIKDMGSILPGHGGVLDRFDALLFVLPAVYYLVQLLDIA